MEGIIKQVIVLETREKTRNNTEIYFLYFYTTSTNLQKTKMMTNTLVVLAIIAIISFDIAFCGVIRDEESFLLGNERISKRSIANNIVPVVEESSSNNGQNVEQHKINRRSIRSDEYRGHDDLLMNIVPKAIFGERIYKKFVEERIYRGVDVQQNVVFESRLRLMESIVEEIPLP